MEMRRGDDETEAMRLPANARADQATAERRQLEVSPAPPPAPPPAQRSMPDSDGRPMPWAARGQTRERRHIPWWLLLGSGCLVVVVVVVLLCAAVGGLWAGIAYRMANEPMQSQMERRTFAVGAHPILEVRASVGNVRIAAGAPGQVFIQATKRARGTSESDAQHTLESIALQYQQVGDTVRVLTQMPRGSSFLHARSVDLEITVPATTGLAVTDSAGSLSIEGIRSVMDVMLSAGTLSARDVRLGDGSRLRTNAGSISLQGDLAPGASAEVRATTGSVEIALPAHAGVRLDALTRVGKVAVQGYPVSPQQSNVIGAAATGTLGSTSGGTLRVRVDTGNITVRAA